MPGYLKCPYCGSIPVDMTKNISVVSQEAYDMTDIFPIGCDNPECPKRPWGNSSAWNEMVMSIINMRIIEASGY
jgi:hypothetical protein